jgi:hypothetical protein
LPSAPSTASLRAASEVFIASSASRLSPPRDPDLEPAQFRHSQRCLCAITGGNVLVMIGITLRQHAGGMRDMPPSPTRNQPLMKCFRDGRRKIGKRRWLPVTR